MTDDEQFGLSKHSRGLLLKMFFIDNNNHDELLCIICSKFNNLTNI